MKKKRQERILSLIKEHAIETQDDMMLRLREEGFCVTQATVSRDLKELKLSKKLGDGGVYQYHLPDQETQNHSAQLGDALVGSITQRLHSMNNVEIKTFPGMAQAVAAGVDSLKLPSILGCVAGDDTIIVVLDKPESAAWLCGELIALLKKPD